MASDYKAKRIIRYDKDANTRIATITFDRPEYLKASTIAARQRYADLLHRAGVDDDVKAVVICGAGDDLGSGADLEEFMRGSAVRANDDKSPPEWRLSKKARRHQRKAKRE